MILVLIHSELFKRIGEYIKKGSITVFPLQWAKEYKQCVSTFIQTQC